MSRRILLLITDLEIGGTPTVVRELATRLNDPPRVVVEVACLKGWGPVAEQLRGAGIDVTSFRATRAWQLPRVTRALRELIADHSIDTVFSFLIHSNFVAARTARHSPTVRWLQSIQTVQERPRWHWWLQRRIHRAAERVVVPSSAVAAVARDRCAVPAEKLAVIPNGIELAAFPRVDVFSRPGVVRVGFLGRFDPVKGLSRFVSNLWFAIQSEDQGTRIEGHIFGAGPDDPAKYIATYSKDKLHERVFVRGPVSRPQDALREMDVLFLPSTEEGFGLVVLEAMASGVPVIAMAAGGVTDIVRDGVNGLLIQPDMFDGRYLLAPLEQLVKKPDVRQRVIEGGLRTAAEFSWDAVTARYRTLLRLDQS